MKLLFIAPLPKPITGQSLASQVLLEALRTRGEITVVNLSQGAGNAGELGHSASARERLPRLLRILWAIWRGARNTSSVYFTISQSIPGNVKDLIIYLICFRSLSRTVIHVHGGAAMPGLLQNWLRRTLNGFFLKRIGAAVVLGPRQLNIFRGLIPETRIHVVPNFAVDALFVDPGIVREKYRSPAPLRLLFLSNLLAGKGYAELVDAFKGLAPDVRKQFQLDFAGGFYSNHDKEVFVRSIEGISEIRFHGVVEGTAKRTLLWNAHVYCLPTYYPFEGQPIGILEAFASGCVVLTTDHSGIFDVFTPGQNGFCVEKGSAVSIQRTLERIVESRAELVTMAMNNRAAAEMYRADRFADQLVRIIGQLEKA